MNIQKANIFARIPNHFFYHDGAFLKSIGGRYAFAIYCLIVSRKSMGNKFYITINEINNIIGITKNTTRARQRIVEYLHSLNKVELIYIHTNLEAVRGNDFICIEWIDRFTSGEVGWTKFYPGDFELYSSVDCVTYCTWWMLRMYRNIDTGTSFPSIEDMADALGCSKGTIQGSIAMLGRLNIIQVVRGRYYYNDIEGKCMRFNNVYKFLDK